MDFSSGDTVRWKAVLNAYDRHLKALDKPGLVSLDSFCRKELPLLLDQREPAPFLTRDELVSIIKWMIARGKMANLLDLVLSMREGEVELASEKAFASLPDLSQAVSNLITLKGVGLVTASAILAVHAPALAPFMSNEAFTAATGRRYKSMENYISFADKLQKKAEVQLFYFKKIFTELSYVV